MLEATSGMMAKKNLLKCSSMESMTSF
jgi:hypothetical protein